MKVQEEMPKVRRRKTVAESFLMARWDVKKNKRLGLDPTKITLGSTKRLWWLCPKTCKYGCKHSFRGRVDHHANFPKMCPFCRHTKVCKHESVAFLRPDLLPTAKDPGDLWKVSIQSNKKIPWVCHKTCEFGCEHGEYMTRVAHQVDGHGCPACARPIKQRVGCIHDSIAFQRPDLVASFHPQLNPVTDLTKVLPHSNKYYWWQCLKNQNHTPWRTMLNNRQKTSCPSCKTSHLEDAMDSVLGPLKSQKSIIPGRWVILDYWQNYKLNPTRLRADFFVSLFFDGHVESAVIEMDGEQHFHPVQAPHWGKPEEVFALNQRNDKRKNNLCEAQHHHLLRVSFSVPKSEYRDAVCSFFHDIQRRDHQPWIFTQVGKEYHVNSSP